MKFINRLQNERGGVLVTGLLFMAILAIMGTAAYLTSSNEVLISKNHRMAKEAYYASGAGLEEARARLRGSSGDDNWVGDPDGTMNADWTAFILTPQTAQGFDGSQDPQWDAGDENFFPTPANHFATAISANSLQTEIPYGVKLRHKTEYDAEQAGHTPGSPHYIDDDGDTTGGHDTSNRGSIIYYGYGDPFRPYQLVEFTPSGGGTHHEPVEIVRAYGFGGSFGSDDQSMKVIEIEVVRHPGPEIAATIYAENTVDFSGTTNDVDGTDQGGCYGGDLPPVYTQTPAITEWGGAAMPDFAGDPPYPVQGPADYDIQSLVNQFRATRDITIAPTSPSDCSWNNETWGSATNFVTLYLNCLTGSCPGDAISFNNCDGWGLLLVDGNLTMSGSCNWRGLILVTGTVTMGGGGGVNTLNLEGAMLAQETVSVNGNIEADYDSCNILNSFQNHSPQIISWRQVY